MPAVIEATLGRGAALVAAVSLILLSYSVLVSYCVVIKTLLPSQVAFAMHAAGLPPGTTPPSPSLCIGIVSLVALIPLSSLSSMEQIKYASIASVVLVYGFVLCVCFAGYRKLFASGGASAWAWIEHQHWWRGDVVDWLRAIPIVSFSFLCHMNVPCTLLLATPRTRR